MKDLVCPGSTAYGARSTPIAPSTSSSMKKFPVVSRAGRTRIAWAASAMISGLRLRFTIASPPSRFWIAAVAIVVRGHRALTPIFPSNSVAIPSTHMLIPNFDMV